MGDNKGLFHVPVGLVCLFVGAGCSVVKVEGATKDQEEGTADF